MLDTLHDRTLDATSRVAQLFSRASSYRSSYHTDGLILYARPGRAAGKGQRPCRQ